MGAAKIEAARRLLAGGMPIKDSENWQAGFLPGALQGTFVDPQHREVEKLIENIRNSTTSLADQRRQLDLLHDLNADFAAKREEDAKLEARMQSFELAYRMQMEAAEVFDVSREPQYVLDAYGPGVHARQLLIARRL